MADEQQQERHADAPEGQGPGSSLPTAAAAGTVVMNAMGTTKVSTKRAQTGKAETGKRPAEKNA